MKVDSYDELQPALLGGHIDECSTFLASRHEADKGSAEYWYWLAQMYYRSGRWLQALDICFRLTRQAPGFGTHLHCQADICAHLGITEIGLSALEALASKPEFSGELSYHARLCGYHYLAFDDAVQNLQRDASVPFSCSREHYRARSIMRSQGIAAGVEVFSHAYCTRSAVAEIWPALDVEQYWHGQLELPRRIVVNGHSSGYGDFIQWARYAQALQALGVEMSWDQRLNGILDDYKVNDHSHRLGQQLASAGFTVGRNDASMWTDPFTLFASLYPVLGYGTTERYIESHTDSHVDEIVRDIRLRAQGKRCVGIFWSSAESNNLYAHRSLRHEYLTPLWEASDDVHWVIMQRGYERTCWAGSPYASNQQRCTLIPLQASLAQTISVIDHLDGFVGNDGVLSHAAGALNKPGYLLLNSQCADWRYEQHVDKTPWYSSLKVLRPDSMGDWGSLTSKLISGVSALSSTS
ncbi:CDC27 family protein [Burkholderia territorii]|uniref:CDC27 family protein n=1 Tax=Burkholderia territorii TaxID=1503055 RepID=UPI0012D9DF15|nr:CDC27 family protein [Burkholderia territorii]